MINVVHARGLLVDQWTGETINQRFRIPRKGLKTWGGCFGTPSTAIKALSEYIDAAHLNADEAHELYDVFQASLRRKPGHEQDVFTCQAAPDYKSLNLWGGTMTLEEYHKLYNHDYQVEAYTQEVLWGKAEEDESGKEKIPVNAPKKWRMTETLASGQTKETRVDMPRCASSFLDFMRQNVLTPGIPNAVTIYFHPSDTRVFGVGIPSEWNERVNKSASEKLGHTPVFGNVRLFHKNKLKENKKRKVADN
jgi:hypothetical protein